MSMRDEVFRKALDLEVNDREELVRQLALSLGLGLEEEQDDDEPEEDEKELEAELMRRLEEYDSGRVKGIPGAEVFRRMEEIQRQMVLKRKSKKSH